MQIFDWNIKNWNIDLDNFKWSCKRCEIKKVQTILDWFDV